MHSKSLIANRWDDDTFRLLDISLEFLEVYFAHSPERAEALMKEFFLKFSERFDEDVIHHESAWRMAAIIHFMTGPEADSNVGDWLLRTGHNQAPPEAMEYFRECYYEAPRRPAILFKKPDLRKMIRGEV